MRARFYKSALVLLLSLPLLAGKPEVSMAQALTMNGSVQTPDVPPQSELSQELELVIRDRKSVV